MTTKFPTAKKSKTAQTADLQRLKKIEEESAAKDKAIESLTKELEARHSQDTAEEKPTATTQSGQPLGFKKEDIQPDEGGSIVESLIQTIIKSLINKATGNPEQSENNLLGALAMDNLREDLRLAKYQRQWFQKEFYKGMGFSEPKDKKSNTLMSDHSD